MSNKKIPFFNREISWLYFNERVLQEAADETVPLIERIKFLSIFSSNLEEFYRVRVATMTRLTNLNDKAKALLGFNPKKILNEIKNIVVKQERKFDQLFQATLINELAQNRIFILNDTQLNVSRGEFVKNHFRDKILSNVVPIMLDMDKPFPELKDRYLYFFVKLSKKDTKVREKYALIEIPPNLPRFLVLPETNDLKFIILAEDIIRYCLDDIFYVFTYDNLEAYSIQLTRDAELDIDKNINDKFIEDLKSSLEKRKKGKPMRLLYDSAMPLNMLTVLVNKLKLEADSLIPGNRYHKFGDFIAFPNVGKKELEYAPNVPLKVHDLHRTQSMFNKVAQRDYLVNLPYQSYDYIILFLREAALDPKVTEIQITLYRLAENSKVINALINAAKNGKAVSVLLELKARFDEQANIYWTSRLMEEGVKVNYGLTDYKVHSKICLVKRIEKDKPVYYANLATGNFNEKTAGLYCDHSIFTAKKEITNDLVKLFDALSKRTVTKGFRHLIVSPLESRSKLVNFINREIRNAKQGKLAYIMLKVNSLADEGIISKLYDASNAGVKIQLIIRGICCLVPGVKGFSENITAISIIDKFLEHARVYIFGNNGKNDMYLSSADLMSRNFEHRVEVGFPVLDHDVKQEIQDIIDLQLQDNTKSRQINALNNNKYHKNRLSKKIRAQVDIYNYLKNQASIIMLRYAAIDIGSNAVRLLIADISKQDGKYKYKKNTLIRVPLRLGDDAFLDQYISEKKSADLVKTMTAFKNLMDVYHVSEYLACATSAMREASNGQDIVKLIKEQTDVTLEIIEGQREANIIYANHIEEELDENKNYLYIDVGGGSTELSVFVKGTPEVSRSFNIGTIRMLDNQDKEETWEEMKDWVKEHTKEYKHLAGIGTGGNINKLFRMSDEKENAPLSLQKLNSMYNKLTSYSLKERINTLGLNPDRADVIIPACEIYLTLMKWTGIKQIYVPKVGMADGIIKLLIEEKLD